MYWILSIFLIASASNLELEENDEDGLLWVDKTSQLIGLVDDEIIPMQELDFGDSDDTAEESENAPEDSSNIF